MIFESLKREWVCEFSNWFSKRTQASWLVLFRLEKVGPFSTMGMQQKR